MRTHVCRRTVALVPVLSALSAIVLSGGEGARAAPVVFVVDSLEDTTDAAPGDGVCADAAGRCSLRAAIQEANALGEPVRIVLRRGERYLFTLEGRNEDAAATGDLDVIGDVSVVGKGATISGEDLDRIFDVHAEGSLTLSRVSLGDSLIEDASGGAIRNAGALRMEFVHTFRGRVTSPDQSGGSVFNDGGMLTATHCRFVNNTSSGSGGAIAALGGETTIHRCEFETNRAEIGGAVHLGLDTSATLSQSEFFVNTAVRGGALSNGSGTMTVERCYFDTNRSQGNGAGDGGGAVYNVGGTVVLRRNRFFLNQALGGLSTAGDVSAGGAVLNVGGQLTIDRCRVRDSLASHSGGAIATVGGTLTARRTRFDGNFVLSFLIDQPGSGGAVHATGAATVTLDRCLFRRNEALGDGGALWNGSSLPFSVTRSAFVGNICRRDDPLDPDSTAPGGGGAVFNSGNDLTVERSLFVGNRAAGLQAEGGALWAIDGTTTVLASRMIRNRAQRRGGGVSVGADSATVLERVALRRNRAPSGPHVFNDGGQMTVNGEVVTDSP